MLYIYLFQYCNTTVIYMSQKGLMQAGGVFRCPSGLSCSNCHVRGKACPLAKVLDIADTLFFLLRGLN